MSSDDIRPALVLYRADVKGLKPGDPTGQMVPLYGDREYTYATTSLDAARAFAVFAFGVTRDHGRSVYRVQLDEPLVYDPEFRSNESVSFYMSHWGTVLEVVEETVTMTVDEAKRVLWSDARWVDDSRMFDDDGYATVPPKWRQDNRFDTDEIQNYLRGLGTFPRPNDVVKHVERRFHWTPQRPGRPGLVDCSAAPHTHSLAEVCQLIGCESEDWLTDRVRNGIFPARRVVRQLRFSDDDIAHIIDACAIVARSGASGYPVPTPRSRRKA